MKVLLLISITACLALTSAHAQVRFVDSSLPNFDKSTASSTNAMPKNELPTVSAASAAPAAERKHWLILPSDGRLSVTFERWAKEAGHRLLWDSSQEIYHTTTDSFEGTFEQALARILTSPAIAKSRHPLAACIYPNTPKVVRITRAGEQLDHCE